MERLFARILTRIAPRTGAALTAVIHANEEDPSTLPRILAYEQQVRELRKEVDELRRDSLRAAELYDLVFERLKSERTL